MKMLLAIVNSDDSRSVIGALTKERFSVTKLATTGGFLRTGNVTMLIGLEDERLDEAIELIRSHSHTRKQILPHASENGMGFFPSTPLEVQVGGATVFVMNVERFEKL